MCYETYTSSGVLVTIVDNGIIRKSGKVVQGCEHLCAIALEETATSRNKEGIPCEYTAGCTFIGLVCHIIADRVLCVTRGREASAIERHRQRCEPLRESIART